MAEQELSVILKAAVNDVITSISTLDVPVSYLQGHSEVWRLNGKTEDGRPIEVDASEPHIKQVLSANYFEASNNNGLWGSLVYFC